MKWILPYMLIKSEDVGSCVDCDLLASQSLPGQGQSRIETNEKTALSSSNPITSA